MKNWTLLIASLAVSGAFAQAATGSATRDSFLKQQAVAEMQRVSAQVDVLATNQEELSDRMTKVESVKTDIGGLKAEIDALKSTVAELRQQLASQREEIVKDLSKKIAALQPPPEKKDLPKSATKTPAYSGPCYEYVVQSGDSLFLIAKAFGTTVQKIKDLNGLKNDRLGIGQKLKVPKE